MRHNVFDLGESDVELQVGFVNKISSWVTFVAPHHSILYAYCLALLLVSIKLLEIIRLGTIPILRQQRDWVVGVRKMTIFADVQYYFINAMKKSKTVQMFSTVVGGSEKVQKCDDII